MGNRVLLIRHAETYGNLNRIIGGDYQLTEHGIQQCEMAREMYSQFSVTRLFTSKAARTIETAKLLFPEMVIEQELKEFNEISFGNAEGLSYTEDGYVQGFKHNVLKEVKNFALEAGGDNLKDRGVEAYSTMKKLKNKYQGETIAIVASCCIIAAMVECAGRNPDWEGLSYAYLPRNIDSVLLTFDWHSFPSVELIKCVG